MTESLNDMLRHSQNVTDKALENAQEVGEQSVDTALGVAREAGDSASDAYESIVAYTQEHPVKSLAFAAGAGALLFLLVRALLPTRD